MDRSARSFTSGQTLLVVLVVISVLVFLFLSLLHFYWAFGGRHWYNEVLPTSSNGLSRLNPTAVQTLIIAFGLLFFAMVIFGNLAPYDRYGKVKYFRYGSLGIGILFLLRAFGDLKFIGFFKKVKTTKFAVNDTKIFSPFCLLIAILCILIFILSTHADKHLKRQQ